MSSKKVLLGVLAGVAVGAVLGILFATDKGSVTREKISKKGEDAMNSVKDKFDELMDEVSEKASEENNFEDIPSTPDEIYNYFEKEDYQTFFNRFIRAFEESVGLNKFRPRYTI